MAMQHLTLPGEIVKKHNRLVRSKIHINNAQASKILASLVACVRADDTEFASKYSIPIKNFINDESGRGYKNIKAACKDLLFAHAEIEQIDSENPKGHPKLTLTPFFREIEYSRGIITAQFNQNMCDMLLQLQRFFTEYNLIEYLKLPSTYSQRIFEILKSWDDKPEVVISVAELHRMLDTPPSFRANFKAFRVRVLEKARKDICEETTLRFEWEPVKAGRSVEKIRFLFAPGRKAIAAKEQRKADQAKQSKRINQRFVKALDCAKGKNGLCATRDNKPIVCALCTEQGFCDDILRQRGKPAPVPVGLGVQHVLASIGGKHS